MELKVKPTVIYFSGGKRVGKDTSVDIMTNLLESREYTVTNVMLAEGLKHTIDGMFDIDREVSEYEKNDTSLFKTLKRGFVNITGRLLGIPTITLDRQVYLNMGKGIKESFGREVFTTELKKAYNSETPTDFIIVSDFRIPEEYVLDGLTIFVYRNVKGLIKYNNEIDNKLEEFCPNYVIINNDILDVLYNEVMGITGNVIQTHIKRNLLRETFCLVIDFNKYITNSNGFDNTISSLYNIKRENLKFIIVMDEEFKDKYPVEYRQMFSRLGKSLIVYDSGELEMSLQRLHSNFNIINIGNEVVQGCTVYPSRFELTNSDGREIIESIDKLNKKGV